MLAIMKERLYIENRAEYEMIGYELNTSLLIKKKEGQ
jgi:hypothetical protein